MNVRKGGFRVTRGGVAVMAVSIALCLAAVPAALLCDRAAVAWVRTLPLKGAADIFIHLISNLGDGFTMSVIFLALLVIWRQDRLALGGLLASASAGVIVNGAKELFMRARPNGVEGAFPSGHSAAAFAAAAILAHRFPRLRAVFYLAASGVSIARVLLKAHYPSDVLVGAAVGMSIGVASAALIDGRPHLKLGKWPRVIAVVLLLGLTALPFALARGPRALTAVAGPALLLVAARRSFGHPRESLRSAVERWAGSVRERTRGLLAPAAVALWAAVMFLPGLGGFAFFDRDEPRYAEAARVMMTSGDYLVPYFNGEFRLHKPPLTYWVMAGGYGLFGVNEFGARIGPAAAGILTCVLVFVLADGMFGRRVGLLSGFVMATASLPIVAAHGATTDSLQLLTVMICFLGFWRIHEGDRGFGSYMLLYGGIALGGLCKGPIVAGTFLLALLGTFLMERRRPILKVRELHLVAGILGALAVVVAWFIPADLATGGQFLSEGIRHHVFDRAFKEPFEGHGGPFIYYLVLLPACFFPWIALLPVSIKRLLESAGAMRARAFLVSWAIAPFLIFSFLKTKLPTYVLPAYPALAIITAFGLDSAIEEGRPIGRRRLGVLGMALFALVAAALGVGLIALPFTSFPAEPRRIFIGAGVLTLTMLGLAIADLLRRRNDLVAIDLGVGICVVVFLMVVWCLPGIDRSSGVRRLSQEINQVAPPGAEILSVGYKESTIVFYTGRRISFVNWPQAAGRIGRGGPVVCVATEKEYAKMPAELAKNLVVSRKVHGFQPSLGRWMTWVILTTPGE